MVLSGLQSGARGQKSGFCDLTCRSKFHPITCHEGKVGKYGYYILLV